MLRGWIVLFFLVLFGSTHAQKESTWWYFGKAAGIEFTNIAPAADTNANDSSYFYTFNGVTYSTTTTTSISNPKTGDLLFYGSMIGVFNADHRAMPGGLPHAMVAETSSGGVGSSAEEGTLIIPRPNHPDQYYLIYVRSAASLYDDGLIGGAFATLVDMELDNGLGDVVDTFKNVLVMDSAEEKLSATPHANGVDYWLMLRQNGTNKYHAFLITESGISTNPVTTALGNASNASIPTSGNLRFNHSGNMMAHLQGTHLDIFDFDAASGQLSNLREIAGNASQGLEFSADDSKLYGGGPVQYDLSVPTQSAISASETILFTLGDPELTGLQLGLDGKIYGTNYDNIQSNYMGCIHDPNALGAACNYEDSVIYLEGKKAYLDVPQFLPNFFRTNFYFDTVCMGDTTQFEINFTFIDSVSWNFDDPASGSANTSTLVNPTHVFSAPGFYTVRLIAQNGVKTDTVFHTVEVLQPPTAHLGGDTTFCATAAAGIELSLDGQPGQYLWNTGSTDSVLFADSSGMYALTITNACGSAADSLEVGAVYPLSIALPPPHHHLCRQRCFGPGH